MIMGVSSVTLLLLCRGAVQSMPVGTPAFDAVRWQGMGRIKTSPLLLLRRTTRMPMGFRFIISFGLSVELIQLVCISHRS